MGVQISEFYTEVCVYVMGGGGGGGVGGEKSLSEFYTEVCVYVRGGGGVGGGGGGGEGCTNLIRLGAKRYGVAYVVDNAVGGLGEWRGGVG